MCLWCEYVLAGRARGCVCGVRVSVLAVRVCVCVFVGAGLWCVRCVCLFAVCV